MDVFELSTINFGLILDGRKSAMEYTPDDFIGEWAKGIKILQKPKASKEDLAKIFSPRMLQDAHESVENMNGLGDSFDWRGELLKAKQRYDLGKTFRKTGEMLESNDDVDLLPLYGRLTSVMTDQSTGPQLMKDIDYKKYTPFMLSGWKAIDDVIGGIPSDGPIVVYGTTGVGKSHWAAKMACHLLQQHPKKKGIIYTLEMSAEHYLNREIAMYPELKTFDDRLYVSGSVRNIEEAVAEITSKQVDFAVIDDMDGMVQEESASEYQRVYKRIREICRFLKIPVIVLAQPNRMAKLNLNERFLSPYDISWSGGGENAAALLVALQMTNSFDMKDDIFPLDDEDHRYMIFWKSRDGWPVQQGPGAIRLDGAVKGKLWSGKPYMNRLFNPASGKARKIGKSK